MPRGRRPLVISEDDVNYYDNTRARGVGWTLALNAHGQVKVEEHDASAWSENIRLHDASISAAQAADRTRETVG